MSSPDRRVLQAGDMPTVASSRTMRRPDVKPEDDVNIMGVGLLPQGTVRTALEQQ